MPSIKPFRGLLYAPGKAPIAKVATEPYDKISPAMQEAYHRRHSLNFVRLILDKIRPQDDAKDNRYRRAADRLEQWIEKGVLRPDPAPAYYLYEQTFKVPGFGLRTRRGIIGLMHLEDFSKGNVLPHERTLAKPRKDRFLLLKATRANLEQIFLMYDDARGKLEKKMQAWAKAKPVMDFRDDKRVRQRLWRIGGKANLDFVSKFLGARKLYIADGHHRYTISNLFHQRAAARNGDGLLGKNSAWRMATFVNLHSPGLVILPTHRLLKMPAGWDVEKFLKTIGEDFDVRSFPVKGSLAGMAKALTQKIRKGSGGTAFGLLTRSHAAVLRLKKSPASRRKLEKLLGRAFAGLDVAILHRLILEKRLGITPKSVERGGLIAYIREPEDVARKIASGEYSLGFLQNPPVIEQVRDIALAGECMPQKSTDFYPKLLSGLVIYDMMERGS